jgi:geranylgeranyl pyrophosphate synthase
MTDMAINTLREADPQNEAGEALFELTNKLLNRDQ